MKIILEFAAYYISLSPDRDPEKADVVTETRYCEVEVPEIFFLSGSDYRLRNITFSRSSLVYDADHDLFRMTRAESFTSLPALYDVIELMDKNQIYRWSETDPYEEKRKETRK